MNWNLVNDSRLPWQTCQRPFRWISKIVAQFFEDIIRDKQGQDGEVLTVVCFVADGDMRRAPRAVTRHDRVVVVNLINPSGIHGYGNL